jgi:hypothetical protein
MRKLIIIFAVPVGLLIIVVLTVTLLTPWMDRWGATDEEIAAAFPGDELLPQPLDFVNRAVSIHASPEYIYPWIMQLDAEKGGWYSYDWLETYVIQCPMQNADELHEEWMEREVGDVVKMCPGESCPPPYIVAQIIPNEAIVMGHQEDGKWVDIYQFVIVPQNDGSSRLILRTRTNMVGGFWNIIHPGAFVMERKMLLGIKERAEALAVQGELPIFLQSTPIIE